ncbi:MAG: protein-L-isoaspartate(D-aspartate) O-methyltransferase [Alphaproteobacteria bacterium]|nr:protein-L-isoaspartate(D-aspartate) O-methyltransferase [Alphaproteobacteria bacterium]MCB9695490.1 protein-L-isoaspartate(D-aspartate) O-methyltransferase [Alphaproteobacteria bacterium]
MVRRIAELGVRDEVILDAMRRVPRDRFVPTELQPYAWDDTPLPIGHAQTISQPYVVAWMAQLGRVERGARVLDVGTGSGYQAAVLAALGADVWSIEVVAPLFERAQRLLTELELPVHLRLGDGKEGWAEHAPYDAILVAAATPRIPDAWLDQLRDGGVLVLPSGSGDRQELVTLERTGETFRRRGHGAVAFVPLT